MSELPPPYTEEEKKTRNWKKKRRRGQLRSSKSFLDPELVGYDESIAIQNSSEVILNEIHSLLVKHNLPPRYSSTLNLAIEALRTRPQLVQDLMRYSDMGVELTSKVEYLEQVLKDRMDVVVELEIKRDSLLAELKYRAGEIVGLEAESVTREDYLARVLAALNSQQQIMEQIIAELESGRRIINNTPSLGLITLGDRSFEMPEFLSDLPAPSLSMPNNSTFRLRRRRATRRLPPEPPSLPESPSLVEVMDNFPDRPVMEGFDLPPQFFEDALRDLQEDAERKVQQDRAREEPGKRGEVMNRNVPASRDSRQPRRSARIRELSQAFSFN